MRIVSTLVTAGAVAALAAPAHADLFQARAEIHAGGMLGTGVGGDEKDSAFFAKAPNGAYGALIGAQVLFADAYIEHTQFTDGSHLMTWTQFAVGMRIDRKTGGGAPANGVPERPPTGYWDLGLHATFGLGTGAQVMPPLDNAQITDKAFGLELRGGFGKRIGHGFRIGIEIPVQVGYFFKSGNGAAVNDLSTNYQGVEAEALLVLGLEIGAL